jgi:putative multiple sugar transport system substrate-binding protein
MRRFARTSLALSSVMLIALAACGDDKDEPATGAGAPAAVEGFAADSLIGVALPDKTSENWVLAGKLFQDGLKEAGFKSDVQYAAASNTVADQQGQISAMVTKGAKVIIIGAKDGSQLGTQAKAAKDAGATVIAYDRLILNTKDVDYYVAFDNFKVGVLQGTALLEGMKAKKPAGPYTIEVFAGSPDDNNARVFFDGAMSVLQPAIDKGDVVIGSGQKNFEQVTTQGWLAENSQRRMDSLITSTYGSKTLDGVLSPNDNLARSIITSVTAAGKPIPVVTGQDSEAESVKWIMDGRQYSTINKDTRNLVSASIEMAKELQQGKTPSKINDTKTYDNGVKVVPSWLLEPVIVTKENAAEAYANDPKLAPLTK